MGVAYFEYPDVLCGRLECIFILVSREFVDEL